VGNLYYALTHDPEPLSPEYAYELSWEAATERLMAAACIPQAEWERLNSTLTSEDNGIEVSKSVGLAGMLFYNCSCF